MKVTLTTEDGSLFTLDVADDLELENFKAFCESESGIPASEVVAFFEGQELKDAKKPLSSYGIKENDMVLIRRRRSRVQNRTQNPGQQQVARSTGTAMEIDWGQIQLPSAASSRPQRPSSSQQQANEDNPEYIRTMFLNDPHQLSLLKERNPELADAITNPSKFAEVLGKQRQEMNQRNMQRIRTMNADIFDADAQREIAEEIRMSNINQNMEAAMEYSPESFARVIMLYINCKLNGHPVKAFVDSGAQMTFMSSACADRCNVTRLIDHRWSGIAQGVGQQKIIGRVHVAQIQIENDFLQSSFSVLQDQVMDLVLGLDMLKRHQCCIDLKNNVLIIGTTGTKTSFLPEAELPDNARLSTQEPTGSSMEAEDRSLAEALERSAQDVSGSSQTAASFPEEKIVQLINMGFKREDVIEELKKCNGDADLAAVSLLAKSMKVPTK